ncbi:MAG: group II intron maturase-specific domain-containing protein [Mariniphaga sp.]
MKQKLKTITRKTTPMSFDERIEKLNEVQRGWVGYSGDVDPSFR